MKRSQLKAILWLRWRLTRNRWARGGVLGPIVPLLLGIVSAVLALVGLASGLVFGALALHGATAVTVMLTWLVVSAAFLVAWTLGVLRDLQRSEIIDIPRLMHLPIALGQAFAVNYLASLLGVTLSWFLPVMLGLSVGLALDRGPALLLLAPLSLGLLFMVTAWTYLVQGWLATWVQNPRRRRVLVTAISLTVVLCLQLPNLALNVFGEHPPPRTATQQERDAYWRAQEARSEHRVEQLRLVEKVVPPLWLATGADGLAAGDPLVALLGTAGFAALGALALRRGYRSTLRFYAGGDGSSSGSAGAQPARSVAAALPGKPRLVERRLPGVPDPIAAVAVATLRALLRAPEVTMGLGFALVMVLISFGVCGGLLVRHGSVSDLGAHVRPFVVVGMMFTTNLVVAQLVSNQFGYDRDGFRALLLAPLARRRLLLGKNLAALPIGAVPSLAMLVTGVVVLRLPPLAVLAAVLQLATMLLMAAMVGNLLSILLPFRVQTGGMKATSPPAGVVLAVLGIQLFLPLLSFPVYAGPALVFAGHYAHWRHPILVDFAVSLAMAAAAAGAYTASLAPLGRLLQRRETQILARVTAEQE